MQKLNKKNKQDDLIEKFNITITNMVDHIIKYHDDNFNNCKKLLEISMFTNQKMPINMFIEYIYKNDDYRMNIREQNESFFIQELEKETKKKKKDQDMISKLFEFKSLWGKIDNNAKSYIKKSMMILVVICDKYIKEL